MNHVKLKKLRLQCKLKQESISEDLQISIRLYRDLETGVLPISKVQKLAFSKYFEDLLYKESRPYGELQTVALVPDKYGKIYNLVMLD